MHDTVRVSNNHHLVALSWFYSTSWNRLRCFATVAGRGQCSATRQPATRMWFSSWPAWSISEVQLTFGWRSISSFDRWATGQATVTGWNRQQNNNNNHYRHRQSTARSQHILYSIHPLHFLKYARATCSRTDNTRIHCHWLSTCRLNKHTNQKPGSSLRAEDSEVMC